MNNVTINKNVVHPCQGCVYFKECGNTNRTEYCAGRVTSTKRKQGDTR